MADDIYIQPELPFRKGRGARIRKQDSLESRFDPPLQFFETVFGPQSYEMTISERIWNSLPIPIMYMVDQVLKNDPDSLMFAMLETVNVIKEQDSIEQALQEKLHDYQTLYSLRSLPVSKRLKVNHSTRGTLFQGIFRDVSLPSELRPLVKDINEEQLFFIEHLGAQLMNSQRKRTFSEGVLTLANHFSAMFDADESPANDLPTPFSSVRLRPCLLGFYSRWLRGKHAWYLEQLLRVDSDTLSLEDATVSIIPVWQAQKFYSSKEVKGLHEGNVIDWKIAAHMGNILEAFFVKKLQKAELHEYNRFPVMQKFLYFLPLLESWSKSKDRSLLHFQEGGFLGEMVSYTAYILAKILVEDNKEHFGFSNPMDEIVDAEGVHLLNQWLPKSKGSTISAILKEFSFWEIFAEIDHIDPISRQEAEETVAALLLHKYFDSISRISLFFCTLARLAVDSHHHIIVLPTHCVLPQVVLNGYHLNDEGATEQGARVDFLLVSTADVLPQNGKGSGVLARIKEREGVQVEIYEIKSQVSKIKLRSKGRKGIEKSHAEQLSYYLKLFREHYPWILVKRAAIVYVDPLATSIVDMELDVEDGIPY